MQNLIYFSGALFQGVPCIPAYLLSSDCPPNILYYPCLTTNLDCCQPSTPTQPSPAASTFSPKVLQTGCSTDYDRKSSAVSVKPCRERVADRTRDSSEEEFRVKASKCGSGVTYKKKNTQSNIVNQTFSYLSSERSQGSVLLFFRNDTQKTEQFYRLMARIRQANKKYINRKYLRRLIDFATSSEFNRLLNKLKLTAISSQEVRRLLRILTFVFLRDQATPTLLTSAKIYKDTLFEHFWRKREILQFLFPAHSHALPTPSQ